MSAPNATELRTFQIRPGAEAAEDQAAIARFLRGVTPSRIETAFAQGAWQVLVLYEDKRVQEERAQIEILLRQALQDWRSQTARVEDRPRDHVLPDALMEAIVRAAPTSEIELRPLAAAFPGDLRRYGRDITRVVRQIMDDLVAA